MIEWLHRKRVQKAFENGHAVQLTVLNQSVDDLPEVVVLNLGPNLSPPMNIRIGREAFEADFSFYGKPRRLRIRWECVCRVQPLYPPSGGGSPFRRAA